MKIVQILGMTLAAAALSAPVYGFSITPNHVQVTKDRVISAAAPGHLHVKAANCPSGSLPRPWLKAVNCPSGSLRRPLLKAVNCPSGSLRRPWLKAANCPSGSLRRPWLKAAIV